MLAAVVVMLTRPRPKMLLFSFLIGGWAMSVTTGLLVLHAFEGSDSEILGSSNACPPRGVPARRRPLSGGRLQIAAQRSARDAPRSGRRRRPRRGGTGAGRRPG